jgi:midasin (ATPase involved in ribosome maturation)
MQTNAAGRFEWVDGALLRAVESGEWVVLDNANFCNPTVSATAVFSVLCRWSEPRWLRQRH